VDERTYGKHYTSGIIIIFYLPKKEASYQKSRSLSYAGRHA